MQGTHNRNQFFGDDLVESAQKVLDLVLDRGVQPILSRQLDELFAILQGDRRLFSVLLQGDNLGNTELRPAGQ